MTPHLFTAPPSPFICPRGLYTASSKVWKRFSSLFSIYFLRKRKRRQKKLFHFISLDFQFFLFSNPLTKNNISIFINMGHSNPKKPKYVVFWLIECLNKTNGRYNIHLLNSFNESDSPEKFESLVAFFMVRIRKCTQHTT